MALLRFAALVAAVDAYSATTSTIAASRAQDVKSKFAPLPYRGVNIGGWLVLESWIRPSLFNNYSVPGGVGEWQFCEQLGQEQAAEVCTSSRRQLGARDFEDKISTVDYLTELMTWRGLASTLNASIIGPSSRLRNLGLVADFASLANNPIESNPMPAFGVRGTGRRRSTQLPASYLASKSQVLRAPGGHWDTWLTYNDLSTLATSGVTHIRIPIGYWILGNLTAGVYVD